MKLVRSLMGRRQFLIAAGVTSTSALALKKLAGIANPAFKTGAAMASENTGKAESQGIIAAEDTVIFYHLLKLETRS